VPCVRHVGRCFTPGAACTYIGFIECEHVVLEREVGNDRLDCSDRPGPDRGFLVGMYNSLVRLKVACDNAWADIDVQLKRRYDLIPTWWKPSKLRRARKRNSGSGHQRAQSSMTATARRQAQAENMLSGALQELVCIIRGVSAAPRGRELYFAAEFLVANRRHRQNARRYYNRGARPEHQDQQFPTIFSPTCWDSSRGFFESPRRRSARRQVSFSAPTA